MTTAPEPVFVGDDADRDPKVLARDFERQVMPLLPKLRQRARCFLARAADAEDLVQETLLRAWKAWGRYEIRDVWAWLWLVMRNTFLEFRRTWTSVSRRRTDATNPEDVAEIRATPPNPPDALATAGPDDDLLTAIHRLPERQRAVIKLELLGLDDITIARVLDVGVHTIQSTKHKARAKIRALL